MIINTAQDYLFIQLANDNIPPTPPGSEIRITEDEKIRITESNNPVNSYVRVTE